MRNRDKLQERDPQTPIRQIENIDTPIKRDIHKHQDCFLFGVEPLHVNFRRGVVLDVVQISDDQNSGPYSSRIPSVLPGNILVSNFDYLKDMTEPEMQRHLLSLYGLRSRNFRWFLIGMGVDLSWCHTCSLTRISFKYFGERFKNSFITSNKKCCKPINRFLRNFVLLVK